VATRIRATPLPSIEMGFPTFVAGISPEDSLGANRRRCGWSPRRVWHRQRAPRRSRHRRLRRCRRRFRRLELRSSSTRGGKVSGENLVRENSPTGCGVGGVPDLRRDLKQNDVELQRESGLGDWTWRLHKRPHPRTPKTLPKSSPIRRGPFPEFPEPSDGLEPSSSSFFFRSHPTTLTGRATTSGRAIARDLLRR